MGFVERRSGVDVLCFLVFVLRLVFLLFSWTTLMLVAFVVFAVVACWCCYHELAKHRHTNNKHAIAKLPDQLNLRTQAITSASALEHTMTPSAPSHQLLHFSKAIKQPNKQMQRSKQAHTQVWTRRRHSGHNQKQRNEKTQTNKQVNNQASKQTNKQLA